MCCQLLPGLFPEHNSSMWMATEGGRVVVPGPHEELPASGAVTHAARSPSHIHFQPPTRTSQWQATLAHGRSHSHTHFIAAASHTQPQRYSCRLAHSLSAMSRGQKGAQGSAGKLSKPSEPLFPKTSQQVSSFVFLYFWSQTLWLSCNLWKGRMVLELNLICWCFFLLWMTWRF